MSITDDQDELRQQNISFLEKYSHELLKDMFTQLENKYNHLIVNNVFDETDLDEVKECIKNEFKNVLKSGVNFRGYPMTPFNSILIDKDSFVYDFKEFKRSAIQSQLINSIYPPLEKELGYFKNSMFLDWKNRIRNTCERVYLKHLLKTLQESKKEPIYPFSKTEYYNCFEEYIKRHIVVAYNDYSYLFQRLLKEKYITHISHIAFMKWLAKNGYISDKDYNEFIIKGNFYTMKKSYTSERENNFNTVFKL